MDISDFNNLTANPSSYLSVQSESAEEFKRLTKTLYDFVKQSEKTSHIAPNGDALSELVIEEFDDEQIWQQIELQNNPFLSQIIKRISSVTTKEARKGVLGLKHSLPTPTASFDEASGEVKEYCEESSVSLGSESDESLEEEKQQKLEGPASVPENKRFHSVKHKKSVVDDKFFKLSELEAFLNKEDKRFEQEQGATAAGSREDESDEESIDYFADVPSDEDFSEDDEEDERKPKTSREATYEDFFDPPAASDEEVQSDLESQGDQDVSEEESDTNENYDTRDADITEFDERGKGYVVTGGESEGKNVHDILGKGADRRMQNLPKSSFEAQQERLRRQINEFEESNLQEKPWQLLGEVTADMRPQNSALETFVKFDHVTRPPPVVTENTTKSLEEQIIQRIKDKAWDDVERKIKPKEEPFEYRRRVVLDQEKSKLSLAEVYEKEYLKQQQKEKEEEELPEHTAIKNMMTSLFSKLDALANFHFVPKTPGPEIKVISNMPAVTVEDVAPVSASDAALLAPEEIKEKSRGIIKGDTEKSKADRKRERRLKKLHQKEKFKAKEKRDALKAKKTPMKLKRGKEEKALKSSKAFFEKLQDEVTNEIRGKKVKKKKKADISTVKLKL